MSQPQHVLSYRGFSSSATSHFFSVPELVGEVVRHLTYYCDCDGSPALCAQCKKTLATVARVSGAFADFAFRRLWATLGSWSPLLNLLPSSFRKKVQIQNSGFERMELHHYDLCAPIVQDEWDRFSYYAHFVRNFQIPRYERISTPDMMTLVSCSEGNPLLPRLEHLGIKSQDDFPLYFFQMLHDYLGTCSLAFPPFPYNSTAARSADAFDHYLKEILGLVNERAPNLQQLALDVHSHGANASLLKLALFRNVRALDLNGDIPCARLIESCASLPKLETLSIAFPDPLSPCSDENIRVPNSVASGFTHLQTLSVKTPPTYALNLLRAIDSRHLSTVSVFSGQEPSVWASLTKTLASRFPHVRDLSLCIACRLISWHDFSAGPPSFADYFGALNGLRELQVVRLSTIGFELKVLTHDVRAMALAWPQIDTLMIEAAWDFPAQVQTSDAQDLPDEGVPPDEEPEGEDVQEQGVQEHEEHEEIPVAKRERATVTSLETFVENCPALRFLELPLLDWKDLEGEKGTGSPEGGAKLGPTTLERLRFTGSRVSEDDGRETCERYVYALFPGLEEIEYGVVTEEVESAEGQSFTWVSWDRLLRWC